MSALAKESASATLDGMAENRVHALLEEGKEDEARKLVDTAVEKARAASADDLLGAVELASALEEKGDFHRALGEDDEAVEVYAETLAMVSGQQDGDENVGRVAASLAGVHDLAGRTMEAKSMYERAIASFERMTPPALLDVAHLSNNLAFIHEAEDNFDRAETLLLKALRISHEQLGEEHEQTATFCNNVGGLYFKADYDEQAREMHMMALDARTKIFGDHHPETAQSHGNLALVLVKAKEIDAGRRHFERALDGFEANLAESKDDYEIVAANYRDVLESLDDKKTLGELDARLKKTLK